jgi:hypothetical protein
MTSRQDPVSRLSAAAEEYQRHENLGALLDRIREIAADASPQGLKEACAPYIDVPEIVIPVYERVTAASPDDAQAMVVLANAYWLTGRGPEVVGELAARAISADAGNRGAWHLWALSESNVRERMTRWRQVTERFPSDQLARAALADNAASLAGAEHDPLALDLAIATYQGLLDEAHHPAQRAALEGTLRTLRSWNL